MQKIWIVILLVGVIVLGGCKTIQNSPTSEQANLAQQEQLVEEQTDEDQVLSSGETALFVAATNDYLDIVQKLINLGFDLKNIDGKEVVVPLDVNEVNEKWGITALFEASALGYLDVVETLLAAGADPNITNKGGGTALMVASERGHLKIVEALLAAGADVNAVTKYGETALSIATQKGHTQIVKLLRQAGAKK